MRARVVTAVFGSVFLVLAAPVSRPTAAPLTAANPGGARLAAVTPASVTRVTLISDSVAAAISFDTGAKAILAEGIDLFLEPGQARLLGGSNPPDGIAPPTVLQLIPSLGDRLGPTVIVCVGYNDRSDQYGANMQAALDALHRANVERVLWVTLRFSPAHSGYLIMNDAIQSIASRHPEVTIVDWDAHATGHPEWFQPDGVHLSGDGPRAMARLFRASLVKVGVST